MIASEQIHILHTSDAVRDFFNKTNFLKSTNKKMIGVSLIENEFILKYYIEIKNDNEFNLKDIIGTKYNLYKKLLSFVDFSKHSCLAVGLKISNNGEIQKYIHFKFKNLKLKSKSYKLKFINFSKCEYGYSIEYNDEKIKKKKYFYFKDRYNKEYIKSMFNLKVDTDTISHFETYQTTDTLKVNIVFDIFKEKQVSDSFLINNNLLYIKPALEVFNNYFKKEPLYLGVDNKKAVSFYYNLNEP
jgi:hypothetical protein